MNKRKKLRTSGEGIHPAKPPKNPRLGDSDGGPQGSKPDCLRHLEESEGTPGPASSTQYSKEEPGQAVSSSPDEETGAPYRLPRPPEREPAALPPSQNSVGRFVPQFSNPRKMVARKAETREEDLGSGTFSPACPSPPAGFSTWQLQLALGCAPDLLGARRLLGAFRTTAPALPGSRPEPPAPGCMEMLDLRKALCAN
ncbi:break repair meiotic recombinase recruitment factor 1 isoform X3 [Microcebus murinus]|uniref:break repair meiotic recombinase recruitment factor 1 isoform X3 n=1 Tax=Microcebus murinus TaxID=30608 RepID=UPI003F6D764B